MRRIIIILALFLIAANAVGQDVEFNIMSWDMGSDFIRDDDNNYFYAHLDQNTGDMAIIWRKMVDKVLMLASIYVKDHSGQCYVLSVSRLNGQTDLKATKSGCQQFDRIVEWFYIAQKRQGDTKPLEDQ